MYLRMVEANVLKDADRTLEFIYSERILTALEQTPGCIFAGLLQRQDQPGKYISLTLWKSEKDAEIYEKTGDYQKNLESVIHILDVQNEWKIQLSKDNVVEYTPVTSDLKVTSYPVIAGRDPLPEQAANASSYLRILSLKVKDGCREKFTNLYNRDILPNLKKVDGCRYAFLLDNSSENGEMISLSIWDDEASVIDYEKSGRFKEFMLKIEHTLGELYKWKMALEESEEPVKTVTSQDIGIRRFRLITGRKFE